MNMNSTPDKHLTNIHFTEGEERLLSKGLEHNLYFKQKNWIETIAIESKQLQATRKGQNRII
jgi:hypothetical protein